MIYAYSVRVRVHTIQSWYIKSYHHVLWAIVEYSSRFVFMWSRHQMQNKSVRLSGLLGFGQVGGLRLCHMCWITITFERIRWKSTSPSLDLGYQIRFWHGSDIVYWRWKYGVNKVHLNSYSSTQMFYNGMDGLISWH